MYRAIVFSRVSSEHQDLVQQTDEVYNEAVRNGYDKTEIIFIEHKESAIKLDESEREGLQKLKDSINKHPIECVFVYEISRISRRPKVLYSIRDMLIERQIQLICIKPYLRLLEDGKLSQTASIMFSLFASLSESEMMLKKERMRRGVNHAKSLGKHAGGYVMFGYTTTKDHYYIIDEAQATIVKRIFTDYVNGKSMRILTRDLQEEGHFKGVKYLTAVQEVYNILHRDCYCGRKNGMPAIISESLYDRSVEKRKSSELKVNRTDNMALLKGILRDGNSGLLLSSNTAANMYYSKRYSGVAVGMHIIEPIIWERAVKLHKEYKKTDKEQVLKSLEKKMQMNMRKQQTLAINMEEIVQQRDQIEERLIKGRLSESKADQMHDELDKTEKELKQRMIELQNEYEDIYETGNRIYENDSVEVDYDTEDKKERYDIVHSVIEKVMLRRESRYRLHIDIYNKVDDKVERLMYNCYTKKFIE